MLAPTFQRTVQRKLLRQQVRASLRDTFQIKVQRRPAGQFVRKPTLDKCYAKPASGWRLNRRSVYLGPVQNQLGATLALLEPPGDIYHATRRRKRAKLHRVGSEFMNGHSHRQCAGRPKPDIGPSSTMSEGSCAAKGLISSLSISRSDTLNQFWLLSKE